METTSQATFAAPAAATAGSGEDLTYRSVSVLSLVSLCLGLVAPLCLMAPLLWVIPLFGVAVAMLALSRIAASDGAMIGRTAALVGLALSVASVTAAAGRSITTRQLLAQQAREVALQWCALIEAGDIENAFRMTVESERGPAPPPPLNVGDGAESPNDPLATFRENPVVHFLQAAGGAARIRFVETAEVVPGIQGEAVVTQQFAVSKSDDIADAPETYLLISLQRSRARRAVSSKWSIANYRGDDLTTASESEAEHGYSH